MSTIRVDNFGPSAGGTAYSALGIAKAWVRFNASTNTIVSNINVASITDNGVGDHNLNYSNLMANTNYNLLIASDGAINGQHTHSYIGSALTTSYRHSQFADENSVNRADGVVHTGVVFGDLA